MNFTNADIPTSKLVTILIPTFQKNHILKFIVDYWIKHGFSVVIADGSSSESIESGISQSMHSTCTVLHSNAPLYERLFIASTTIDSPYVLVLPDDELWTIEAVDAATALLESDNSLSFVFGETLEFFLNNGSLNFRNLYRHADRYRGDSIYWWIRLLSLTFNYHPAGHWSIFRVGDYKEAISFARRGDFNINALEELFFEFYSACHFRGKHLNISTWLRNAVTPPNISSDGIVKIRDVPEKQFPNWWLKYRFSLDGFQILLSFFLADSHSKFDSSTFFRRLINLGKSIILWSGFQLYHLVHYSFPKVGKLNRRRNANNHYMNIEDLSAIIGKDVIQTIQKITSL